MKTDETFDELVARKIAEEDKIEAEEPCPSCDGFNIVYGGPDNKMALCLDCGKEWFL